MRINGKSLIVIVGFVMVAAAGALGLDKLGGFAVIKEFYQPNAAHQVTAADVAKDVQVMKHETRLPKALADQTELVEIRADGQAVVFVHRLTFEANPSKADDFLAAVRTNMPRRACTNKSMPKAMNQGVVFRYQYADMVGFNVGSFDIGGNDCAGIRMVNLGDGESLGLALCSPGIVGFGAPPYWTAPFPPTAQRRLHLPNFRCRPWQS